MKPSSQDSKISISTSKNITLRRVKITSRYKRIRHDAMHDLLDIENNLSENKEDYRFGE
jgi:hypothetical protein